MLTRSSDASEFYVGSLASIKSFLRYKGVADTQDLEDIISEFTLEILYRNTLTKAMQVNDFDNYMIKVLQNVMNSWIRKKFNLNRQDSTFHNKMLMNYQTPWGDTSAISYTNLYLGDFRDWYVKETSLSGHGANPETLDKACNEIRNGDPLRSNSYHCLRKYIHRYRKKFDQN
jgi:hypothetical protein